MKNWYVLFTGYENTLITMKRLVKSVLPKGCGAYVPTQITGNKERPTRLYNKSLYPFYIFICCNDEKHLGILERKMNQLHIDGYFLTDADGKIATLTQEDIRSLCSREGMVPPKTLPEANGFTTGDSVVVIGGPMKGLKSRIAFLTKEYAFVSLVTQRQKPIELPILYCDLEKQHG